jgi:GntR family transcriptional regulator
MTKTSAIAIQIVTGDARPIFRQIVDGIRKEIALDNLKAGSKLPSVRGLAMQLGINANTVAKAYSELTTQGLIESRKGLGLFVTETKQMLSEQEQRKRLIDASKQFVNEVMYLDFTAEEITDYVLTELQQLKTTRE